MAASTAPALAARLDAGVIAPGKSADLVVLDQDLNIKAVYIDGKLQPAGPSLAK